MIVRPAPLMPYWRFDMEKALEYVKDISRIIRICKDMNDREMMNYTQENRIKAEAENKVYNEIGGLVDRLVEILERT